MIVGRLVKGYYAVAMIVTILVINQLFTTRDEHAKVSHTPEEMRSVLAENINGVEVSSKTGSKGRLLAVVNTPNMGTGGLVSTAVSKGCRSAEINEPQTLMYDCADGQKVVQTRMFNPGSKVIGAHMKENPEDQCLIITAIRKPESWFASRFLESLGAPKFIASMGGCNVDEWPSKEVLLKEFKTFLQQQTYPALNHALPALLNNFGTNLEEQFELTNMAGFSEFGPAPPESIVAGCKLLFLRIEQSEHWPAIFEKIDPTLKFSKGQARIDQCPSLTEHIKTIIDYEMTAEEKNSIYQRGDEHVKDWFKAYGYTE